MSSNNFIFAKFTATVDASQPSGTVNESATPAHHVLVQPNAGTDGPMDPAQEVAAGVQEVAAGDFVNEVEQPQQQQEAEGEKETHQCMNCQKVFGSYANLRRHESRIKCRHFFNN